MFLPYLTTCSAYQLAPVVADDSLKVFLTDAASRDLVEWQQYDNFDNRLKIKSNFGNIWHWEEDRTVKGMIQFPLMLQSEDKNQWFRILIHLKLIKTLNHKNNLLFPSIQLD
jgi:hypothetical protein